MSSVFDVAGQVTARQVAERAGIRMRPRGRRAWACCPLHGEKTASMMFDDAGRWHCFGCNRGGDAIDLYVALNDLTPLDAARRLAGEFGITIDDTSPTETERRAWAERRRAQEAIAARERDAYGLLCWAEQYINAQRPTRWEDMTGAHKQLLAIGAEIGYLLDTFNYGADGDRIPGWGQEVVRKVGAVKRIVDSIGQPMLGGHQRSG